MNISVPKVVVLLDKLTNLNGSCDRCIPPCSYEVSIENKKKTLYNYFFFNPLKKNYNIDTLRKKFLVYY